MPPTPTFPCYAGEGDETSNKGVICAPFCVKICRHGGTPRKKENNK